MKHIDHTELARAALPTGVLMFSDLIESLTNDQELNLSIAE